eukprot:2570840-Karenia_brevis.AAC.1
MPVKNRLPIPLEVLKLVFIIGINQALGSHTKAGAAFWLIGVVLMRLGFFGLLRPSEIVKLKRLDIKFVKNSTGTNSMVLALRSPKNRASMGRLQFVIECRQALIFGLGLSLIWAH